MGDVTRYTELELKVHRPTSRDGEWSQNVFRQRRVCDTSCMEWSEACSVRLGVDWTWQISSHCSDRGHNEAGETLFYKRGVY